MSAVERAARAADKHLDEHEWTDTGPTGPLAREIFIAALDVDEITEILAREQWNSLPLVIAGEMPKWDAIVDDDGWPEVSFTRDRVRPFAIAIRSTLLGEEP
jgi:hypothetical protein